MILKIVCCLVILVSCFSFTQNRYEKREEKLEQLKSRNDIKVTEIEPNLLKLEYTNGKILIKNIADYQPQTTQSQQPTTYSPTYDSTIIDLTTIDTSLYSHKFKFWREAPIGTQDEPIIGDINSNELPEIYGHKNLDTVYINVAEMNSNGNFNYVYEYDSALIVKSIYDIDKDEEKELLLGSNSILQQYPGNGYLFYKKESDSSLATQLSFIFYRVGGQQENNYFGDWDGDNYTDWIFVDVISALPSINIYEFNPSINYFDSIYSYDIGNNHYGGFAIGDFDQDGKIEFLGGSIQGDVVSIENNGNNNYGVNWNGSVATYNAYLATKTNDLDENGKEEIWIAGAAFYNGEPRTRITIFESFENDYYYAVGRIDLLGVFTFDAGNIQSLDVDKDGKDEVMICIDANVIILKFAGSENDQKYEVYYIKQNSIPGVYYYGAAMYDLDNDGKEEIIISMQNYPNFGHKLFSNIYKPDSTTNVINETPETPDNYFLYQNYPNPFNPSTIISWRNPSEVLVKLQVFDILGREVSLLVDEQKKAGYHFIEFDASALPSGTYFYKIQIGRYHKVRKMILQK